MPTKWPIRHSLQNIKTHPLSAPLIRWGWASKGLCVESSPPPAAWLVIRIGTCDLPIAKHKP